MSNLLAQVAEPQSKDTTFIYGLVDPRTGCVRYVGKANNTTKRYNAHFSNYELSHHTRKVAWIKSLLALGLKPNIIVIEEVLQEFWEEAERRWIAYYRSIPGYLHLTNGTSGGEGAEKGHKKSPETLQKLSLSLRGHQVSQETKNKISIANSGKRRTPEQIDNIRKGNLRSRIYKPKKESAKPPHERRIRSSKFRGVSWSKKRSNWRVTVSGEGEDVCLRPCESEIEAAHTYDLWVIQNRNPNASTNFPREQYENKAYTERPKIHIQRNNTSGYRGVTWFKKNKNWQVSIDHEKNRIHVGYFSDKIEAARAYDRKVIELRYLSAYTNFPRSSYE
jgi:hypothetical protein